MILIRNSIILQFIYRAYCFLREIASQSSCYKALCRLKIWLQNVVATSEICNFFSREGVIPRHWKESLLCRWGTRLINLPSRILSLGYRRWTAFFEGCITYRAFRFMAGKICILVGMLMVIMMATPHDNWNNVYGFMGIVLLTAIFIVGRSSSGPTSLELSKVGPYLPLYALWICYGFITSFSTSLSLRFFLFHLTGVLMMILVVSGTNRYGQLQAMVALTVFGVTVAAVYGCYQGLIEGVEVVASQQDLTLNEGMPGRVYAFFDNPNNFAQTLVMLIPLDLALVFNCKKLWAKGLALVALIPCTVAIGLTYSRSGWIGLVVAIVIFIAFYNWKVIPLLLVFGVLALPFLPETIYNRIMTIGNMEDSSTMYRFAIYGAMGNLLADFWHSGVGLGTDVMSRVFSNGYPTMYDGSYPVHSHNNYLQMWIEVGFLGALSYGAMLLYPLKSSVKAFGQSANKKLRCFLAAATGGLCGIMVIGIAEYTWYYPRNMFLFFFLLAVIMACLSLMKKENEGVVSN